THVEPQNETEKMLVDVFKNVLNLDSVSTEDNFFEIGGDSLKAIKLSSILSIKYNVSLKDIFENNTIIDLSKSIIYKNKENITDKLEKLKSFESNTLSSYDKEDYYTYYEEIKNMYGTVKEIEFSNYKNVFLTGATGYFGIHLLKEILDHTKSSISILMRKSNNRDNLNRIKDLWLYYFNDVLPENYKNRITVFEGDISKDNLGLNRKHYDYLAKHIDIIINSAANVQHFTKREKAYSTNTESLKTLINFSNHIKIKEIHHMSTISIASGIVNNHDYIKFTEEHLDVNQNPNNVYVESKLDGEIILDKNRSKNTNINIYRLGNLQCSSKNGIFQLHPETNAFFNVITSLKKLGFYPSLIEDSIEFTEVDKAAEACIKLIFKTNLKNETYHIYNPNYLSLEKLMNYYRKQYDIKPLSWTEFIDFLIHEKYYNDTDYLDNLLLHTGVYDDNIFNKTIFDLDSFKTNYILKKINFKWNPVSKKLLSDMFTNHKNSF
ncbi:SDR family oxidoreductase, partial [Staphylococcus epidermidis]|uniref:SDR family oxidoreductase n=1 Tax=Staphylococcus epidermidis TaxID=1282 RepID=UPI001E2E3233